MKTKTREAVRVILDLPWDSPWQEGDTLQVPFKTIVLAGSQEREVSSGVAAIPVIRDSGGDLIAHVDTLIGEQCGVVKVMSILNDDDGRSA